MDQLLDNSADMTPEERRKRLAEIARDPDRTRGYAISSVVAAGIRAEQDKVLMENEVLVCYALRMIDRSDALTEVERRRAEATRSALDEEVRSRAAVLDIVTRIQEDAELFESEWRSHISRERGGDRTARSGRRARPLVVGWRVTATTAVALFLAIIFLVLTRGQARVVVEAPDGAIEEVLLADGSRIRLVGPSNLSYVPAEAPSRPTRVQLSGNAYLDVVAGSSPFVVETATARVSVVGTNFGLRSWPDETEVVLASGRLSVSDIEGRHHVVMESGFASTVPVGGTPSEPREVDLTESLSWSGLFVFRGDTMTEVAAVLSQQYRTRVLVDPAFESQRISGTFDRESPLRETLATLATSLGAVVMSDEFGMRLAQAR